ncbi:MULTISPECIES: CGNR zinc finger domain-containing protein [Arthrobacter]|uniref:CGNR zinc finger domain-containing protein n=2 Tax=Arthrobacter TaxID=1663 RepID=A0ABU9KN16_9MICC|nr:CGNR zinc finger domain-containing protein [Arthrobacter sp. YJM1]MDP5226828.1 CGNR zinc finger domain-containing protein [Arthrobacter sp. YJM1]
MIFTPDTESALRTAVNLINSGANGAELLDDDAELTQFLAREGFYGSRTHEGAELESIHRLRGTLRTLWTSEADEAAELVNGILRDVHALPQLMKHDGLDWHLHGTTHAAPLADRMGAEAAMAILDVIRSQELSRLLVCAADDCDAVVLDLSRNRSKRFCDTGNCANRTHVAAYRARQRG